MNATINNISNGGNSINVFVSFSNGQDKVYTVDVDNATGASIRQLIRADLASFNQQEIDRIKREERAVKVVALLQTLQGQVLN